MLTLTRRLNESIRIGNDIKLHVIKIESNKVRIGIEAPKDLRILRNELPSRYASEIPSQHFNGDEPHD